MHSICIKKHGTKFKILFCHGNVHEDEHFKNSKTSIVYYSFEHEFIICKSIAIAHVQKVIINFYCKTNHLM